MRKSNEIFITFSNSLKLKSTNESSEVTNKLSQKDSKILEKEKITENFFDYLINENSNYANFQKVTEYYERKLSRNKSIYDQNFDIIKNKKEEIKELKVHMFDLLVNHVVLENKNLNLYYEKMKEKLKKEINLIEHELEVYKNSHSEIYKLNYTLNSKLENISKSEKIFEQQHEKYVNIREAALSKLLKQEEMLKTLNFYFEKIQDFDKNLIAKKQKKLKQLNYEIHVLKSDEAQNEINLKKLSEKNYELNEYIQKRKYQNLIYIKEIKSYISNYMKDSVNMNSIHEITKEQNVDYIINKYNKIKFQNKELSTLFSLKSKKIINLNSIFTTLNNEYNFILKSIKQKIRTEKEETKNNIMNHDDYIDKMNIKINKTKNYIEEKNKVFLNNFKLLINIIYSTLKLISNINHSLNITSCQIESLPYVKRDDLIEKNQNYFDTNFTNKNKINFESNFINQKFLKFLIFLIKELNFQIKSIISNVYYILYASQKEKKERRNAFVSIDLFGDIQKSQRKKSSIIINDNFISGFNNKEYQKLYEEELKIKKKKLEERKKFFEFEEKEFFKKKLNDNPNKRYEEDENTNINSNNNSALPSIDLLNKNRSADCISTKDFIQQYYKYYNRGISEYESMNNSLNKKINLNKFNFIINYTNEFVSNIKEYEDKKLEKYQSILIKSKKIKEENEKKEISKYLKKSKKIKKLIRDQFNRDISTDSEKDEKVKKEELALQMVTKELAELKKPKKFMLKYNDKEVSKIYERFDDIRALELNFLKNKGNFLLDSGFFNEYYFKLKKQYNENKMKAKNMKIRIQKNIRNKNVMKGSKNNFISSSVNNFESLLNERGNKSDRNQYEGKRKIILKKINKNRKSLFRNNSEILNNNYNSIKLSKKFD